MPVSPVAIVSAGMVTSVGWSAPASTAAIRCGLSNAEATRFIDWGGEWMRAHTPGLEASSPRSALVTMAAMAIDECLERSPSARTGILPLVLLCVGDRPSQPPGTGEALLKDLEDALGRRFDGGSRVLRRGRVGAFLGLHLARELLSEGGAGQVLLVAADSLVDWDTLQGFESQARLLTSQNSNGFLPGEAACALLLTSARGEHQLACLGLGFAREASTVNSEEPTRGQALTDAFRQAASECGWDLGKIEVHISDLSGEQYFFREATLARTRCSRTPTDRLDIWHPAESIGEVGAAAGAVILAVAVAAFEKGYLPGRRALCHVSADSGERAAVLVGAGTA